jgi:hypothetical protein
MVQSRRPERLPEDAPDPTGTRKIVIRRTSEEPETYASPPPQPGYPPARQGRSGCFWLSMVMIVFIVAFGAVVVAVILSGSSALNALFGGVQNAFNPAPVANVTSAATIINSIQPLGELVTVNAQMAKPDLNVNIQQGVLNACSFSTSYVAQASINAGIDLMAVGPDQIDYNALTDTYTITLPAPRLISCSVDYIDQYAASTTLCSVDWDSARQIGQYIALQEFRQDALDSGLLERARRQAELVVGNFVGSLTGSRVQITFDEPAGDAALPPSCQPPLPGSWTYDDKTQIWTQP